MKNFTRIDFFVKFLKDDTVLNLDEVKEIFPDSYEYMYFVYNQLREYNIKDKNVINAHYDNEGLSIGIELDSEKTSKKFNKVKNEKIDLFNKELTYSVKIKFNFVFFTFKNNDEG